MTSAEYNAAAEALRKLRDSEMPWYARSSVTEEVIERVVRVVIKAAEKARDADKQAGT